MCITHTCTSLVLGLCPWVWQVYMCNAHHSIHVHYKHYTVCNVFLDGLSAQDIGNNKEEGSVLVSVPVNAAQRVRSVTQLIHSDSEKKSK